MNKCKSRNLTIVGIILILLLSTTLLVTMNYSTKSAKAESPLTLDSMIYTNPSAFEFTPISNTECSVKLIDKTIKNVRVPKTAIINGTTYDVTEVAQNGFSANSELLTAILPSVHSLDSAAFQNCKNLELVYTPKVKEIGTNALALCPKLTDFIIPATVETIGGSVFLLNNTTVHARFDEPQSGWASNWNVGNRVTIENHDFNVRDTEGILWTHDFVYEEIQNPNPLARSNIGARRLAPLQPFMENINNGHKEIQATDMEIMSGAMQGLFQSITILPGTTPINIWTSAFTYCTSIEGITFNRDITYNCGYMGEESTMVFNNVITPYISLPTPNKILSGMFFCSTIDNINFKTASGITYQPKGVVRIPDSIHEIGADAFNSTNGIVNLHIPSSITNIGENAFYNWNDTQVIHMPFLTEAHANSVLGTGWKQKCTATIETAGAVSVVSQPTEIQDDNTYKIVYDFRINKNYYTLDDFTYSNPYTYWDAAAFSTVFDYTKTQTDTLQGDFWIRRLEFTFKLKPTSSGGSMFIHRYQVLKDGVVIAQAETEKITVHKFIRSAADFNALDSYEDEDYNYYLLNDISLGTLSNTNGIKAINRKNLFGNYNTISYNFSFAKIPGRSHYYLCLFKENAGDISQLKVNATINVSDYETLLVNGVQQGASVDVGGIAHTNKVGARILDSEVTMNVNINAPGSSVGGIANENDGLISGCVSKGSITTTSAPNGAEVGGITTLNGYRSNAAKIVNCTNHAAITSYGNIGGIARQNMAGEITNCSNTGTLTYKYTSFNKNFITTRSTGGIVGINQATCTNSTNSGRIRYGGADSYDGLIQPIMGNIVGSFETGTLSGNTWTGIVDTTGLDPHHGGGFDQTLYARNAEYGKRGY